MFRRVAPEHAGINGFILFLAIGIDFQQVSDCPRNGRGKQTPINGKKNYNFIL